MLKNWKIALERATFPYQVVTSQRDGSFLRHATHSAKASVCRLDRLGSSGGESRDHQIPSDGGRVRRVFTHSPAADMGNINLREATPSLRRIGFWPDQLSRVDQLLRTTALKQRPATQPNRRDATDYKYAGPHNELISRYRRALQAPNDPGHYKCGSGAELGPARQFRNLDLFVLIPAWLLDAHHVALDSSSRRRQKRTPVRKVSAGRQTHKSTPNRDREGAIYLRELSQPVTAPSRSRLSFNRLLNSVGNCRSH
jgi:hypothetical protein